MVLTGSLLAGWVSAFASSASPFLNDLIPLAKSPIRSEILPRPPNSSSPTARTSIQCQMLNEPMRKSSGSDGAARALWAARARCLGVSRKLGFGADKYKDSAPAPSMRSTDAHAPKTVGTADVWRHSTALTQCRNLLPSALSFVAGALRRRRQAKIEVARLERILVLAQGRIVRRHRHREARRQPAVEQARALQLVEARQIADRVEPEMREECLAGAIGHRPARRLAPPARTNPAGLQQHVHRAFGGGDAADVLDLRPRHRLVIGDDRERLDRGARELAGLDRLLAQQPGEIAGGAKRPLAVDAHEID